MHSIFSRKPKVVVAVPAALAPEDPVNYNSVIDYLVGLSADEYDKLFKVAAIFRDTNSKTAEILGIEDKPVTFLFPPKPTEDDLDEALDTLLSSDGIDFLEDDLPPEPVKVKVQSPSTKSGSEVSE